MKNELMTAKTVNAIVDKECRANLKIMLKAEENGNKASWQYVDALANIVNGEQFKEDFGKKSDFANFIGKSNGYLSQAVKASGFRRTNEEFKDTAITVTKCYLLACLSAEDYADFIEHCKFTSFDIVGVSDKAFKDELSNYFNHEEAKAEAEAEAEAEVEAEAEETERILVTDKNGNEYLIPVGVLNKYRIEKAE